MSAPRVPLNQSEFDTDLFTGSANYSYPIKVPKGTNDLTPDISLSYSSSGTKTGMQKAGVGWQVNHDFIERDNHFTATDTNDDTFKLHFKGSVHDLVYVSGEGRYHTKIESNLYIKKYSSGGSNTYSEYWEVITTDGTKYRFGYQNQSELVCSGRSYVKQWDLDLVTDTHNNNIYYTYTDDNGVSYPDTITYNNDQAREIIFGYTSNGPGRRMYIQGCLTQETSKLYNIQIKTSGSVVREFDLGYTSASNSAQLLNSVTEKGSSASASLPPTTFSYNPQIKGWPSTAPKWLDHIGLDAPLNGPNTALIDATGDGLADIVKSEGNGNNTWKVWKNTGSNFQTFSSTWVNNYGIDAKIERSDTRLIDVTGDNRPDIVKMHNDGGNLRYKVVRNTGYSWDTSNITDWVSSNTLYGANITNGNTEIIDVNGDNLADIVQTQTGDSTKWRVFKNTGSSWSTSPVDWAVPTGLNLTMDNLRVIDVNGDGLQDIVTTSTSGSNTTWNVYANTGSGWETSATHWISNVNIGNGDLTKDYITLADVNGDGLPDIVRDTELGSADKWEVLLNYGKSWSMTWETWIETSQNVDVDSSDNNVSVADVDGDGFADIIRGKSDCSCSENTFEVWSNKGRVTDLIANITTSMGGMSSFEYASTSAMFDNTGSDSLSDLPFGMPVVKKMTVSNGMPGTLATSDVTTYSYQDGFYDWEDREFRGFAVVDTVEPNTSRKKYVFNQSDDLQGLLTEVQTRNNSLDPYAETENTWSSSLSNGVYTVKLDEEKEYTYDGTASNPKIRETEFTYDSYGNVTKTSELGDTSVSGDERFIYNDYTASTSAWIVNTPKKTYVKAANDSTKVSETSFYYDGNTSVDAAPIKGDVTKEIKWLSGGTNPETEYEYDEFGNVTKVIDPNNNETTYEFNIINDYTYTYPERVTNAKGQQATITYDRGTGNILSKTDANGLTIDYEYDYMGRFAKEVRPYDDNAYPTVFYEYDFDGVAPEGIVVRQREDSGTLNSVDTYTYVDGLNRKVQIRADAADTQEQIVIDTYYDPTGEVWKETVPYFATASANFATPFASASGTRIEYDPLGRVSIVYNPKGGFKTTEYDHWKETDIDENGHIKRRYLNAYGKISRVDEVIGVTTHDTNYVYNTLDQLTQIIDSASNSGTMTYDTLGRKTSQTDPDMGTWSYVYDAAGNLTSSTDARNITIGRTYDELNRLIGVQYPTDTDLSFAYDLGKIGTLSIATDSAGTVFYGYDDRLRKTEETRVIGGTSKTTEFVYDSADRLVSQINPDSTESNYTFNEQGEIESLEGILDNIDYNALGKITSKEFDNGLTTNYTYNTDDFRLNRIQTDAIQDLNYTYDPVGNITSIVDDIDDKTKSFTYDDLDRLITASESAGFNYAYEYNPIGNLTKFTNAGSEIEYEYGAGAAGPHALTGQDFGESIQQMATDYSAEYFNNNNLSGSSLFNRIDASINFDWGNGAPAASMSADNYSVRWTKTINFDAGNYVFSTTTDDGVRLYIDNQLVIDKWIGQSSVTHTTVQNLSAGNHTVKMEYYEGGGGAVAKFNYLKLTEGFTGEYFSNTTLSGTPTVVRNDAAINFDWDTASPAASMPYDNFSVRWNKVASFSAGIYQFTVKGDDGIRLYVDEQLLIDGWVDQGGVTYSTTKAMAAGDHRIRVEYYDSGWTALAQFTYEKVAEPYTGEYFNNQTLSGSPVITRTDAAVDFNWGDGSPHASISANQFSARWTKTQNFAAGDYEFSITGDDGIRLIIDNVEVINGWYDQGSVSYSTTQTLSAGNHTIKVEYYEGWSDAVAKLSINKTDTNISLHHQTATSSAESSTYIGSKAVDGNTSTRWSSSASDPQWISVDLGSRKTINRVKLNWHTNYGQDYQIQVSDDASSWTTVKSIWGANGGVDDLTGFHGTGRYVRVYGTYRGTANGYSLYEFDVYGTTAPTLPTPSGTPVILYDANGNMLSEGTKCYEYNEANQMKKVKRCANNQTIAEYVYDYTGQRMVKKNYNDGSLSNTVISWTKSFETKDVVGGSISNTNYYFADSELIARKNPDGGKYYYHNDHLNSAVLITNQSGDVVEETKFDPWGAVLSGSTQSKFLYTGQEHDTETRLNYYGARYYNSDLMRFTQPDSIVQDIYDPQMLNRYAYARNNPLKYIDPSGHVVNCTPKGCSSSISILNTPKQSQPKQQTASIALNLKNVAAASTKVSTPPQPNRSSTQSGQSTSNSSGSVAGSSTNSNPQHPNSPNLAKNTFAYIAASYNRGNIDIGVNFGSRRFLGGGFGVQVNREGITPYVAGGAVIGRAGGAIIFSDEATKEDSTTFNVQTTIPIVSGIGYANNISFSFDKTFLDPKVTHGIGISAGISATINHTFRTFKW